MGAALRVAGRHDTATSAAPPTPRVQAPRGAGALARAAAASLAAAALYTLACPPHEWSLLAWLVPGLLLVAVGGLTTLRALACGALFGVAIGCGITGWAYHAALEYFAFNRALTAGFVVAVWLVYSGVPHALLCAAYAGLAERVPGWARGPLGAWLWVASEWLRSTLGTGMPWELLGHTQFRHLAVIQIADLGGVYAVSFVMALASVSCAELLGQGRTAARPRPWCVGLALPAAVLLATGLYGAYTRRLYAAAPAGRAVRMVAVVQGNIPNEFRWKRAFSERMLATYARLSGAARRERQGRSTRRAPRASFSRPARRGSGPSSATRCSSRVWSGSSSARAPRSWSTSRTTPGSMAGTAPRRGSTSRWPSSARSRPAASSCAPPRPASRGSSRRAARPTRASPPARRGPRWRAWASGRARPSMCAGESAGSRRPASSSRWRSCSTGGGARDEPQAASWRRRGGRAGSGRPAAGRHRQHRAVGRYDLPGLLRDVEPGGTVHRPAGLVRRRRVALLPAPGGRGRRRPRPHGRRRLRAGAPAGARHPRRVLLPEPRGSEPGGDGACAALLDGGLPADLRRLPPERGRVPRDRPSGRLPEAEERGEPRAPRRRPHHRAVRHDGRGSLRTVLVRSPAPARGVVPRARVLSPGAGLPDRAPAPVPAAGAPRALRCVCAPRRCRRGGARLALRLHGRSPARDRDPRAGRADDHRGGRLRPGDEPLGARAAPGERGRARYARRLPDPRRADGGLRLLRRQGAAQRRRLHGVPLPREPRVRDRQAGPLRDRRHAPPRDHVRGRGGGHRQPLLGTPLGGCLLPAHSQPGGTVAARAGDPQPGAALPDRARARPRAGRRRPPLLPQSVRRGAGPLRAEPCPRLGTHPRRGGRA